MESRLENLKTTSSKGNTEPSKVYYKYMTPHNYKARNSFFIPQVKTIPVRFEPLANEPILDFIEVVMPRTDAIGERPGQANSGEGVRMFQVMLRWLQFLIHFSKVHVRIQPVAHF